MVRRVDLSMVIDRVDRLDRRVGVIKRDEVFEKKAGFRVVHVLFFDDEGRILLQQLAKTRIRHPEAWGSSVAGYVFSGESYWSAARRRIKQELGVESAKLRRVGKTMMVDEGCHKFITLFIARFEGPFEVDKTHIKRIKFFSPSAVEQMVAHGTRRVTPTLVHLMQTMHITGLHP